MAGIVGRVAAALAFLSLKSCTVPLLATASVTAPVKLLAWVFKSTSALLAVSMLKFDVPVTVMGTPLWGWVMLPLAVTFRVPTVPPPRIMALVSLRLALVRLPLFAAVPKVTVPKLLA